MGLGTWIPAQGVSGYWSLKFSSWQSGLLYRELRPTGTSLDFLCYPHRSSAHSLLTGSLQLPGRTRLCWKWDLKLLLLLSTFSLQAPAYLKLSRTLLWACFPHTAKESHCSWPETIICTIQQIGFSVAFWLFLELTLEWFIFFIITFFEQLWLTFLSWIHAWLYPLPYSVIEHHNLLWS